MNGHPLISVDELAGRLATVTLLDVRWSFAGPPPRERYAAGHLPTARFVDLDTDLADPPGARGRHPLPDPERFAAAMRRVGVRHDRTVVVYDDAAGTIAARAWWLLRHHGHDDVRVLDGGLPAWTAAGHPLTAEAPITEEGDFTAAPGRLPVLDAVTAAALARDGVLLDARDGERYRGETEPIDPVGGHIPGACSAPTRENVGPDGRFRAPDELQARFEALGADGSSPVGAYCGSGVTAAHEVLALTIAGVPAALYPGSWSEWVADPARPVAPGADRG